MANEKGWIKIYRKIMGWRLYPNKNGRVFTKFEAFMDLLLRANYDDSTLDFNAQPYEVKRGEILTSERQLSERWRWSRSKVQRFLNDLKRHSEIDHQPNHQASHLIICNYEGYQGDETTNRTTNRAHNKNIRNKEILYTSLETEKIANFVKVFHRYCPSLPSVRKLEDTRKKRILVRISERDDQVFWREYWERIEKSDFLTGRRGTWRAGLDWALKPANMAKVLEGNYDNRYEYKDPMTAGQEADYYAGKRRSGSNTDFNPITPVKTGEGE